MLGVNVCACVFVCGVLSSLGLGLRTGNQEYPGDTHGGFDRALNRAETFHSPWAMLAVLMLAVGVTFNTLLQSARHPKP